MAEYRRVSAMLGVEAEAPELDERTAFWIEAFNLLCRARQPSMGGILPISPVTMLDMADRLEWPCEPRECVEVISALDDAYMDMHGSKD